MSLTSCLKKAGASLHAADKAAILEAARKYRKQGLSADEAGMKAIDDQIAAVQQMMTEAESRPAERVEPAAGSAPEPAADTVATLIPLGTNVATIGTLRRGDGQEVQARVIRWPSGQLGPYGLAIYADGKKVWSAPFPGIKSTTTKSELVSMLVDYLNTDAESAQDKYKVAKAEPAPAADQAPVKQQSSNADAEQAAAKDTDGGAGAVESAAKPGEVADKFGASLPPARRAMAAKLDEALSDEDIAKRPLSEIWPLAENDAIEDTFAAAVAHAARAEVPAKPRQPYKLRQWVAKVKSVRELAGKIVSGRVTRDGMIELVNTQHRNLKDWLSKVLLLEQVSRDQWKRIGSVEERPEAFTYEGGKQVPTPILRVEIDGKAHWLRGDSGVQEDARGTVEGNRSAIMALLADNAPDKRMEFEIRGKSGGPYKINKKGDPEYRPLMTFATVEEARRAINVDYDSLAAAWEAVKARDNITERDLRNAENRPRAGKDHRGGKDIDAQQFQDTFGFRGGEFGKWVQQGKGDKERQALLNSAYDALMDLSDIVGVPPRAISLNGSLGIAFGSRGSGWASAHFEPSNLVINLTKTRGAGSLAHEWLHAMDNYFGRMRRGGEEAKFTGDKKKYHAENFITHRPEPLMVRKDGSRWGSLTKARLEQLRRANPTAVQYAAEKWMPDPSHPEGVRPEVERAFADLVAELNASPMAKRAQTLDKGRDGYWSSTLEMAARAFESFVMARMHESGYHNDFLVNVKKAEDVAKDPARYPYLMAGEIKPIADAFGALFDTIQTRETEGGNVAMFSRATPFIATDTQDGFPTYANAEAGIDLSFPQKAERFEVIDVPGDVVNYAIMPLDGFDSFGYVELLVQNGRPVSLLDIEVTPQGRRNGIGRKVIETLLAANPGADLEISNIVPEARGFWARMGVPEQNVEGAYDGTLNWQTYSEAQDSGPADRAAQAGRGARAKRDAGAEGSPSAPGGQVPQGLTRAEAQALLAALESAQGQILRRPITAERAREIARAMGATVNVVQSVDEIPAAKRESLLAQAPDGRVRGAFFRDDSSVWLVMDNVHSEAEAAFVILHEAFHRGLAATIGADSKRLLRQMYLTNPRLNQLAREQMKMHGIGQDEAIEEALADLAGRGQARDLRGWSKLLDMIRGWLSKVGKAIGMDIKWSDDMIEDFVAGISRAGLEGGVHVAGDVKASQADPQSKWYSALRLEVAAANIKSAPAAAWTQYLDALVKKGAVKADEVEWTGLREWLGLQPGKITREQVGQFLAGNGVQVTETVLGSPENSRDLKLIEDAGYTVEEEYDSAALMRDGEFVDADDATVPQRVRDAMDRLATDADGSPTKYGQYTLPGGTNYREVLLTLPAKDEAQVVPHPSGVGFAIQYPDGSYALQPDQSVRPGAITQWEDEADARRYGIPARDRSGAYRSSHWDQPNILAHIRVNDRVDSDGKRVLFVEEVQSDYAQAARKTGIHGALIPQSREWQAVDTLDYARTRAEAEQRMRDLEPSLERNREPGMENRLAIRQNAAGWEVVEESRSAVEFAPNKGGVPRAPFIDTTDKWVSLALKRIVKMAVDGGYDKVAFVTGEQSAERYDLSKQVDSVTYSDEGVLRAFQGRKAVITRNAKPEELTDLIGKEAADRLMKRPSEDGYRTLSGEQLKVGGEGMKAFYDRIVPSVLKDVLRKVGGGQVGEVTIGSSRLKVQEAPGGDGFVIFDEQTKEFYRGGQSGRPWVDYPRNAKVYLSETSAKKALPQIEGGAAGLQQPGFTITPAMREKAAGGMPLFSRASPIKSAQDLVNSKDGVFDFNRIGETRQDRVRTVVDGARPFWLGALTRDQIADIYGDEIQPVREYDTLTRAMENERSKIAQDADTLYREWAGLDSEANNKLARLMLDATVNSVHPDGSFTPIAGNDAETEAARRVEHARVRQQFQALPAEAQAMYRKVRDFHSGMLEQLRNALVRRIERQVQAGQARAAALTNIRLAFDRYKEHGPYFPLSRFGDFLVIGTRPDGERVVASYETSGEQQAAARALRNDGFTVKSKTAKDYSRSLDGSAGRFAGDVLDMLANLDMEEASLGGESFGLKEKLLDDVNQMFIRALPDLSYRKHFAHRKNTPGFSSDMMRGFASSAFHAASHIARLNHADRMTFALEDAFKTVEQLDEGDFNKQTQVLNELAKRHDAAMNPNTHPIAAMLNQVGFVMYLGASPAAGLVNLLQTPMVTLPYLGARHGFAKASASMAKATRDIMGAKPNKSSGWNAADSLRLTTTERETMRRLQDEGVIDLTQAHDLSAATGLDTGNVARSKAAFAMSRAMRIVGWTFHVPEVMNRQVTALSAYRLEMQASGDQAKAENAAREAIKRTHFDYSASNRARFMQGNVARVLLQFKQYAQNMTYLLGRAAYVAMKDADPEVRAIARRQLVATLGATFAMAGALGLPGVGAAAGLIGALVAAVDDDDKPWDWKVEFRNLLADTFGKEAGEVLAHGLPRALVPWEISNRVGMGELWFRSNDREGQSPREAFATDMANILGPTAGSVLGLYTAADHMARGNWAKAAESMVPKFIRDPIQAGRIASEGVTSYTGDHLMDVTEAEVLGKLLGFTPARASEMYEARNAVKNAETVIMERRKLLIGRAAKARIDSDSDELQGVMADIAEFNRRNPAEAIKSESIAASVLARMRHQRQTQDGTYLPKNRDHLREIGRFASIE